MVEEVVADVELHVARHADQDPPLEKQEHARDRRDQEDQAAEAKDRRGRDTLLEIVDRPPDDGGRDQGNAGGEEHADRTTAICGR